MRTGTRFGGLRTHHANESVAVCEMMLCRIELQKRCTNEQTLHMQQYTSEGNDAFVMQFVVALAFRVRSFLVFGKVNISFSGLASLTLLLAAAASSITRLYS